jgi:hypothetical protein
VEIRRTPAGLWGGATVSQTPWPALSSTVFTPRTALAQVDPLKAQVRETPHPAQARKHAPAPPHAHTVAQVQRAELMQPTQHLGRPGPQALTLQGRYQGGKSKAILRAHKQLKQNTVSPKHPTTHTHAHTSTDLP